MKIRCLMMFKNEDDLLTPWALYHGARFGFENLILFDNGSTSSSIIEQIAALRDRGVRIDRTHDTKLDFLGKGDLFAATIRRFDEEDPADFYLALDCDEFVGVAERNEVSCSSEDIQGALAPFLTHKGTLSIRNAYQNIPGVPNQFRPAFGALTKLFFARNACQTLDHGFHAGTGREPGPPLMTPLVHVHYHNKPLPLLQQHARQKLEAELDDLSPAALAAHREARGACWHVIDYFDLKSETEYRASFTDYFRCGFPAFEAAFREIGCDLPFSNDQLLI